MCGAFGQMGFKVYLFFGSVSKKHNLKESLKNFYGISIPTMKTFFWKKWINKGLEFFIAILSIKVFIFDKIKKKGPDIVYCRNIYAAIFFKIISKSIIIYETHTLEIGFRKRLQKYLLNSQQILTIVISLQLKRILIKNLSLNRHDNIYVCHDCANVGHGVMNFQQKLNYRSKLFKDKKYILDKNKFIGYFGHLYSGRGIGIIRLMAYRFPNFAFVIFGGEEEDLAKQKEIKNPKNLYFMGFISPNIVNKAMSSMDILLMPYQKKVGISGSNTVNTVKWMSPMKMFEYMSVGVPIISSDLKVLREVLNNDKNAVLVKSDQPDEWANAIKKIVSNPEFAFSLGKMAYNDFINKYTWSKRVKKIFKKALNHS